MPIATIKNVRIHYEVIGQQGPWVTLITGGRRGFQEFVGFANKIAANGFQVLLHDRRNTGASDIYIGGEEGEEEIWADDLALLLHHLDIKKAFIGGTSSGARLSLLFYKRHPQMVLGLLLMRITGGEFAAGRLPENYYGQFIRAAQQGGMKAVCQLEQIQERIRANPDNEARLMAMDPAEYIRVMSHWLEIFQQGPRFPVLGISEEQLQAIRVPCIVIPGNDKTHSSEQGRAAQLLIPGSQLHQLPIDDQDVALVPFEAWEPLEAELTKVLVTFMTKVLSAQEHAKTSPQAPSIRRVFTGHNEHGEAVVLIDEICKHFRQGRANANVCNIWTTETSPANNDGHADAGKRPGVFTMIQDGSVFRILDFHPGVAKRVHRSDSIDYIVVMQGRIDMELEPGGEVVQLKAGDVMVQRGTVHNWVNRYDETCIMAVILIHAHAVSAGGKTLEAFG